MMMKIRVLLAEDHTIVRKGLLSLLEAEEDIQVAGEAEDGRQAVSLVKKIHPDVVLMDISMPKLNGLEATRQIKKILPDVKVLILTVHTDEEYVYQILKAGASGYLVKQAAVEELIIAIKSVYKGDFFLSPSISKTVIEEYIQKAKTSGEEDRFAFLTGREREVLQLIAEGHSNKEIAYLLNISVKTVEAHRANLMAKLDIHTTAELTQYSIRKGLISPER